MLDTLCNYEIRAPEVATGGFIYFDSKILENTQVTLTVGDSILSPQNETITCDVE